MPMLDESASGIPQPPSGAEGEALEDFYEEVLVDFILRREEGENPDIDDLLARYPRHAEDLARLLAHSDGPPPTASQPGTLSRERKRGWPLRRLGDYEILFHVASTGGANVYKAKHSETGEEVALKVVRKAEAVCEKELKRFEREAKTLAELENSMVVPLIEIREDGGLLWMALPWIEGITLKEAVEVLSGDRRPGVVDPRDLSIQVRVRIIAQVARLLANLAARGIMHRDLKPSNIMLTRSLEPVLIDFGIARNLDQSGLTATSDAPLGTPRYLAPELITADARAANERSEVYGLGLTLWSFLTAATPYDFSNRRELFEAVLAGKLSPPHLADRRIPSSLSRVVMRAVTVKPEARIQSLSELADALESWIARKGPNGGSRRIGSLAVLLTLLGLLAAALWWLLR